VITIIIFSSDLS